jgi:hypothetical protein
MKIINSERAIDNMIWICDRIKTRLLIQLEKYDLDVPIQVEIEYRLESKEVLSPSISKKTYFNHPLLIKEAYNRSENELDNLVDKAIEKAIHNHFASKGYSFDKQRIESAVCKREQVR